MKAIMRRLLIILLSAISLTAFAQDKKNIVIAQPQCQNAMVAKLITSSLSAALAQSDEWQPVERPSDEEMKKALEEGGTVGNMPTAQYMLTTSVDDMGGMSFISCRIMDIETSAIVGLAMASAESSPQSIKDACTSLAQQLLAK